MHRERCLLGQHLTGARARYRELALYTQPLHTRPNKVRHGPKSASQVRTVHHTRLMMPHTHLSLVCTRRCAGGHMRSLVRASLQTHKCKYSFLYGIMYLSTRLRAEIHNAAAAAAACLLRPSQNVIHACYYAIGRAEEVASGPSTAAASPVTLFGGGRSHPLPSRKHSPSITGASNAPTAHRTSSST
jgi:hypothetical protein